MSEIHTVMRCITICMQGITHWVQTRLMHVLPLCINRLYWLLPQFFASGPRDLAHFTHTFLLHLHTFMWKCTVWAVINDL